MATGIGRYDLDDSSCRYGARGRLIRKIIVYRQGTKIILRSRTGAALRHFLLGVKDIDHCTEGTVGHSDIVDIYRCIHSGGGVGLAEVGDEQLRLDREGRRSGPIAGSGGDASGTDRVRGGESRRTDTRHGRIRQTVPPGNRLCDV